MAMFYDICMQIMPQSHAHETNLFVGLSLYLSRSLENDAKIVENRLIRWVSETEWFKNIKTNGMKEIPIQDQKSEKNWPITIEVYERKNERRYHSNKASE